MITSVPCNYENSFLTKLLSKDKPASFNGKTEAQRLEEMSQQVLADWFHEEQSRPLLTVTRPSVLLLEDDPEEDSPAIKPRQIQAHYH